MSVKDCIECKYDFSFKQTYLCCCTMRCDSVVRNCTDDSEAKLLTRFTRLGSSMTKNGSLKLIAQHDTGTLIR